MGQGEPEPVGCMSLPVPGRPYTHVTMLPHTRLRHHDNDHLMSNLNKRQKNFLLLSNIFFGMCNIFGSQSRTLSLFLVGVAFKEFCNWVRQSLAG